MSVIVYELNEVPKKILDFYANSHPNSAFAYLRHHSKLFETKTADVGGLSPWITWPTMHRGVSNIEHEITDLGQNLNHVNEEFPNIHQILAKQGVKVGVFGCLQSYPLPKNLDNFGFYVPDTFAAGDECFPDNLTSFQAFNLSMVRLNARNVSKGIAVKDAVRFILKSKQLGLKLNTFMKLTNQIISERINSNRVVRRRTSQVEIAFDLYMKQVTDTNPDISFFFTNHLASSMHRYWPTIFPEDYEQGKFDKNWLNRWSNEIPHAVKVANYHLTRLINYCKSNDSELIVCSSMGQAAVINTTIKHKLVLITNIKNLLAYLGVKIADWEPRLSMAPQVVIMPKNLSVIDSLKKLKNIFLNGKNINFEITSTGEIRFDISLINQESLTIVDNGKKINNKEIGVDNVNLQDAAGSYAYHIQEGILLHYNPKKLLKKSSNDDWKLISALDFAPSLLNKFNKKIPSYMKGEKLFNN
jgi:hypothetical protein